MLVKLDVPKHFYKDDPEMIGSLVCTTEGFPTQIEHETTIHIVAWPCSIEKHHEADYKAACELIGTDEQKWCGLILEMSDDELRRFAKTLFNIDALPSHVRIWNSANPDTGEPHPAVEAIYDLNSKEG